MRFIIKFEARMTLFELTYVQENTQIFKRKERTEIVSISAIYCLSTAVIFFGSLIQYIIQSLDDMSHFEYFELTFIITQIPIIVIAVGTCLTLAHLIYLMRKRHNYEY